MKRKPLTNKSGEVRELTKADMKRMHPTSEVLPKELWTTIEDRHWAIMAEEAAESGYLGVSETKRRLDELAKRAGINTKVLIYEDNK